MVPAGTDGAVACVDEYERIPWETVMRKPHTISSAFMVRKGLIRKANLASHVKMCIEKTNARSKVRLSSAASSLARAQALLPAFVPESRVLDLFTAVADKTVLRWHGSVAAAVEARIDEDLGDLFEADTCGLAGAGSTHLAADRAATSTVVAKIAGTWLLKPSMANKGAEIYLVHGADDVSKAVSEWPDVVQWVLQRYVAPPLTASRGRKFHLRMYVLAVGACTVFVYREGLVLLATLPHADEATATSGRLRGSQMHSFITNTCVAADRAGFDEASSVRLLSELPTVLDVPTAQFAAQSSEGTKRPAAEAVALRIYSGVRECVARLFASMQGSVGGFMPLPNAYELFGLDFVVRSSDCRPMLLEVNAGPDLKQTGDRLRPLILNMLQDTVDTALLPLLAQRTTDGGFVPKPLLPEPRRAGAASVSWDHSRGVALQDKLDGALVGTIKGFVLGRGNGWDPVLQVDWGLGTANVTVDDSTVPSPAA